MNWNKLEIVTLVGGFAIAALGKYTNQPLIISIGIGVVALAFVLVGLEAVITRKMKWGITMYTHENYRGIAAVALGLIIIMAGFGFGVLDYAQATHQGESLFGLLFSRPGPILLIVGGVFFLRGLAGVIGSPDWNKSMTTRILNGIVERLAMLVFLLLGLVILLAGAMNLFMPAMFSQLMSTLGKMLLHSRSVQ
jgi:hypothetical protein